MKLSSTTKNSNNSNYYKCFVGTIPSDTVTPLITLNSPGELVTDVYALTPKTKQEPDINPNTSIPLLGVLGEYTVYPFGNETLLSVHCGSTL